MEFDFFGHGKSWNLNFQKEYEPCPMGAKTAIDAPLGAKRNE